MKSSICILLGFMLFSCSYSTQKKAVIQMTIPSIAIDVDNVETLKLSDFFMDISYIPLSDSFLISTIERAKIYDDKLFLLTNKSVLIFDTNLGESLLNIRHLGAGPGEYISLYDMLYDEKENLIELLDMNKQKVLRYGFDGTFINEFKTSFFSFSFYKVAPSIYLFYNSNMISDATSHKLIRYDTQISKITGTDFLIDKHLASYFFMLEANNFGSMVNPSFLFSPSDTIYGFTDNYRPFAKYVLDFGKHHTPSQFYRERYADIQDFSVKAVQRSYIYTYGNFNENDYVAALSVRSDKTLYWVLYDKETQIVRTNKRWIDDFHSRTPIEITYENGPFIIDQKHLYFFLQPSQLISLMENEKNLYNRSSHNILDEIYYSSSFSEQSNPILVKCKFKEL